MSRERGGRSARANTVLSVADRKPGQVVFGSRLKLGPGGVDYKAGTMCSRPCRAFDAMICVRTSLGRFDACCATPLRGVIWLRASPYVAMRPFQTDTHALQKNRIAPRHAEAALQSFDWVFFGMKYLPCRSPQRTGEQRWPRVRSTATGKRRSPRPPRSRRLSRPLPLRASPRRRSRRQPGNRAIEGCRRVATTAALDLAQAAIAAHRAACRADRHA